MTKIFDWCCIPFGYAIRFINSFSPHYIVTVVLMALLLKAILFVPTVLHTRTLQTNSKVKIREEQIMQKYRDMKKLLPDSDLETRHEYNKQQEVEILAMYKDMGYHFGLAGVVPIIQYPVLVALYRTITNPLTFIYRLSTERITEIAEFLSEKGIAIKSQLNMLPYIAKYSTELGLEGEKFPSLSLFGQNLSDTPSIKRPILLAIPIMILLCSVFYPMIVNKRLEISKNPLTYVRILFTTLLSYTVPAIAGMYWIVRYPLNYIQQILIKKILAKHPSKGEIAFQNYQNHLLSEGEKNNDTLQNQEQERTDNPEDGKGCGNNEC